MTINIEYETDKELGIPYEEIIEDVVVASLDYEGCPYETEINLLLTNNESIKKINSEYRGIDMPTDVLSFPMIEYETPSDFDWLEESVNDNFNPETGELILGDIIISIDKVISQAQLYGHSVKREFAFLIVHSMLHLFGYDHMVEQEAMVMEDKQRKILDILKISR